MHESVEQQSLTGTVLLIFPQHLIKKKKKKKRIDCYFLKLFLFLFPFGDSSYMNIKVLIDVVKLFFLIILCSSSFSLSHFRYIYCCDFKFTNHFFCHI